MKAFIGSMTGRVFATLLLGILVSAALTQWLADVERQRVFEHQRDQTLIERAETLIMATEIVPASSRRAYLAIANRHGLQLEVGPPYALAPRPSNFGGEITGSGALADLLAAKRFVTRATTSSMSTSPTIDSVSCETG